MSEQKNKARTPTQKRSIETKKKIIEAAEVLFAEKGFYGTNALEIAARAGVATGSFYGYYNNKKEVLIEMIRNFYAATSERVLGSYKMQYGGKMADNISEEKKFIHFMIQALYETHDVNIRLHKEFIGMAMLDKEIEEIHLEEERKVAAAIASLLSAAGDIIRVKDIEAAAVLLYRVSEEIIHRIRIIGTDIGDGRLLGELEDMVCRYLLVEG